MPLVETVSEQLKRIKGTRSYADIAAATGINEGYMHRIMHSQRNLTLATLEKVADALGHDVYVKLRRRPKKP